MTSLNGCTVRLKSSLTYAHLTYNSCLADKYPLEWFFSRLAEICVHEEDLAYLVSAGSLEQSPSLYYPFLSFAAQILFHLWRLDVVFDESTRVSKFEVLLLWRHIT